MFNRTDILARYPWLTQRQRPMIIGNDLDALLSAQFLQHTLGWRMAGFYNYTTLYHDPTIDPRACVWIDLDVYQANIPSLGHHILRLAPTDRLARHRLSVNPNLLRGIDQTDFTHKYPLGTIHFLLWLHEVRLRNRRAALLLVWLADSAWINAQHYRANVREWLLEWLPQPDLVATFEQTNTVDFEAEMQTQVLQRLANAELPPGNVQNVSAHLGLGGYQCTWDTPEEVGKVRRVTDLIERTLSWKRLIFPREFKALTGKRSSAKLADVIRQHGSFDEFLANERVFSYVIPNKERVNYTTGIALRAESQSSS